jgi:hypothetical protein
MEKVGGSSNIGYNPIEFCRHLKEALHPGTTVFRALALVAVRQQHYQATHLSPLGFAARYELVNHRLGSIEKIAKLGFPQYKRIGISY